MENTTTQKKTKTVKAGKKKEQVEDMTNTAKTTVKKTKKVKEPVVEPVVEPEPEPEVEEPVEEEPVEEVVTESSEEAVQNAANELDFSFQLELLHNKVKQYKEESRDVLKSIEASIKQLSKIHTVELRNASKKKKKTNPDSKTGAKMEMEISNPLMCELLGIEVGGKASRADAMKKVFGYFKEHNLQDPEDKKKYVFDDKLTELFGGQTEVTHQGVMGLISPFFPKKNSTTESF